jgi:hypothetical protein
MKDRSMQLNNPKIRAEIVRNAIEQSDELIRRHFNEIAAIKDGDDKINFSIGFEISSPSAGADKITATLSYSKQCKQKSTRSIDDPNQTQIDGTDPESLKGKAAAKSAAKKAAKKSAKKAAKTEQ